MKKPAVIIDIDDTIADSSTFFLKWINARSVRQFVAEELDRTFRNNEQPEYATHMKNLLSQPELAVHIKPFRDALASIKQLHESGHELHIVTARDTTFDTVTREWLQTHGFIDYIEHIHIRPNHQSGHEFKREIAETIQPLAAFDDTFDVGSEIASAGVYVYLIDKPWNIDELLPAAMERVPNFTAGVQRFLQRKIA